MPGSNFFPKFSQDTESEPQLPVMHYRLYQGKHKSKAEIYSGTLARLGFIIMI